MKKLLRSLFIALIPLAAVSCAQDDMAPAISEPDTPAAETQPGLFRSAAEAIQQAITDRSNMLGIPTPGSRAELDVKCIKRPAPSRSGENDTLLYVVNFPDEEGYAVIPADRRIETLTVTEAGSFSSIDEMQNPAAKEFMKAAATYARTRFEIDTTTIAKPVPETFKLIRTDTTEYTLIPPRINLKWGQSGSLGKYCSNGVMGCVPLACAMALSYFEQPRSITLTYPGHTVNSVTLNWPSIKKHVKETPMQTFCICGASGEAHDQLAHMCRQIGELIGSQYIYLNNNILYPATSGTIEGASTALSKLLPSKTKTLKNYNSVLVGSDLSNGILVMFGIASIGENHAWICDGYYHCKTIYGLYEPLPYNDLYGNPLFKLLEAYETVTKDYTHVNWGWDGRDNGYYVSGIFETLTSRRQLDDENDGHVTGDNRYPIANIKYIHIKI